MSELVVGLQGVPSHKLDLRCEHVHLNGDVSELIGEFFELSQGLGKNYHGLTAIASRNVDLCQHDLRLEFVFVKSVLGAKLGQAMDRGQRLCVILLLEQPFQLAQPCLRRLPLYFVDAQVHMHVSLCLLGNVQLFSVQAVCVRQCQHSEVVVNCQIIQTEPLQRFQQLEAVLHRVMPELHCVSVVVIQEVFPLQGLSAVELDYVRRLHAS